MFPRSTVLAVVLSTIFSGAASAQGDWHQYSQSAEKYFNQHQYAQAKNDCLHSLQELDKSDPRYALSLIQLSRILVAEGNTLKGMKVLQYGLELCRSTRPICLDVYCELLKAQALLYKQTNQPELAKLAEEQLRYIQPPAEPPKKVVASAAATSATPGKASPTGRRSTVEQSTVTTEKALAELDERVREMWKEQREREERDRQEREAEEFRIVTQQRQEYEQQLSASRQFETQQLAAHMEREKISAEASAAKRSESTVPLNTMSLQQMTAAESYAMAKHRGLPAMTPIKGLGFYSVGNASK